MACLIASRAVGGLVCFAGKNITGLLVYEIAAGGQACVGRGASCQPEPRRAIVGPRRLEQLK